MARASGERSKAVAGVDCAVASAAHSARAAEKSPKRRPRRSWIAFGIMAEKRMKMSPQAEALLISEQGEASRVGFPLGLRPRPRDGLDERGLGCPLPQLLTALYARLT